MSLSKETGEFEVGIEFLEPGPGFNPSFRELYQQG